LIHIRDKLNVLRRAEALGIPVPKTYEIASPHEGMLLSRELPYPVVVKPTVGSGSAGVAYVDNAEELLPVLERLYDSGRVPFIQERLPHGGQGIGASFLMDEKGEMRASFVHRRLREYPVRGGPSTLRESFVHDQAKEDGARLLRSFGFVGAAMVEFKMDLRDGKAKLLEINPRFWGSLALAIDSGVNFPLLITLMALGYDFAPVETYRLGHRCRWLLPGDILHFLENPNRWHMEPGFFRFNGPNLTYDIIDPKDPFPIVGTLLSLLPFYGSEHFAHVRARRIKPRSPVVGGLGYSAESYTR
jgi:predicted ATP-grasp superfamily ATP-dependent carboligase